MRNFGLVLLFSFISLIGLSQTPCEGASGEIMASGYYSTYDNYYQQCVGQSMTFTCENVALPDGGTISSIEWWLDETLLQTEPDGSLIFNPIISTIGNISAHVNSSTGCTAVFNLDLPIVFITTPVLTFDNMIGSCDMEEVPTSISYDAVIESYAVLPTYQSQLFDHSSVYTSSISVNLPNAGAIQNCNDLEFLRINLEHSYIGDVVINLTCPNGTTTNIKSISTLTGAINFGQAIDNDLAQPGTGWDYYWSENANNSMSIYQGTIGFNAPLPTDLFLPEESFCNFIGCPINGDWTLTVQDMIFGDNGYVFSWSLAFPEENPIIYNNTLSGNNIYSWSSSEFQIINESEQNAYISFINENYGVIHYELTNTAGCLATAEKEFTFLQQDVLVDAGPDFVYSSDVPTDVTATIVDLNPNCIGESVETSLCYENNATQFYTFCASDYFDCSNFLQLQIEGYIENNFDSFFVWEGTDTSQEPIYSSTGLNNTLNFTSSSGCFTLQILSDGSGSWDSGQFDPLTITLNPSLIDFPTYQWSPSEIFETPTSTTSNVLLVDEETWATFTYDIPSTYGCAIADSLLITVPDNSVILTVFLDENNNGIFDESEPTIPYYPIAADQLGTLYTNANGQVFSTLDEATSFEIAIDSWQWNLTTPALIEVDPAGWQGEAMYYYIGVNPTANLVTDIEVSLEGVIPTCNMNSFATASVFNDGNFYPGGQMHIQLDPLYTFISSSPSPISIENNFLIYGIPSLNFHQQFDIELNLQNPDETAFGELVSSHASGYYFIDETTLSTVLDTDSINGEISCAYDPNNKITHTGIGAFNDIAPNTWLEYTINFQNIGNAEASSVVITDELSALLDLTTIQPIASSHNFVLTRVGNLATFTFDNINLPGVEQDEAASHGYVRYRINQLPNLPLGATINNTATIVFDSNEPIITNTATNRIFIPVTISESAMMDFEIYPNPAHDYILWDNAQFNLRRITSSSGAEITIEKTNTHSPFQIEQLAAGVYFFEFVNSSGIIVRRPVIIQH